MDENLVPSDSTRESKVLCFNVKGDCCRYLADFATGDAESKASQDARVAHAGDAKTAEKDLVVTHPTRLGLVLNFSVFRIQTRRARRRVLPWRMHSRSRTSRLWSLACGASQPRRFFQQ